MVENGEADDKIVAVLIGDPTYGELTSIGQLPRAVIDRLRHYFLTYKTIPGDAVPGITVDPVYDVATAHAVLAASRDDYRRRFPEAAS
jgi:inorganic pyrophosphatase